MRILPFVSPRLILLAWLGITAATSVPRAARADEEGGGYASAQEADEAGDLGIGNFSRVSPGIYRGARPALSAIAGLRKVPVRTIIDLQGGDGDLPYGLGRLMTFFERGESNAAIDAEEAEATAHDIVFFNLPLPSVKVMDATEDRAVDQALQIMRDASDQGVFVHCEHGNDRTGMVVALYRVCYEHETPEDAHDEMVRMGHRAINRVVTWPMDHYFWKKARAGCGPVAGRMDQD